MTTLTKMKKPLIYVFSGCGDKQINLCSIEVFDIEENKWKELTSVQRARSGFASGAVSTGHHGATKIYIIGGCLGGKERTKLIEEFDTKECKGKTLDLKLPRSLSGMSAAVLNNMLYICGGTDG
jgi:N-acetylneuraminic acid mutarotase